LAFGKTPGRHRVAWRGGAVVAERWWRGGGGGVVAAAKVCCGSKPVLRTGLIFEHIVIKND